MHAENEFLNVKVFWNGVLSGEEKRYQKLTGELSEMFKTPNYYQQLIIDQICLRFLQLDRLRRATGEYWKSLLIPEILEPVMPEVSVIHYTKQQAYVPQVNFRSLSKIANEIHALEAGIENQIMKMMKALG